MRCALVRSFIVSIFAASAVLAGGSPQRTLVVVNDDSDQSLEAGRYYADLRGIPDRNIFHLSLTNRINIELESYSNLIEGPVHAYINDAGLSGQVDTVVFSMDFPYRVFKSPASDLRWAGLTASMYYGFYSSPSAFTSGCETAAGSAHDFFEAERGFDRFEGIVSNRYYLTAMITASNLANAKNLIRRSVASDQSMPQASVYMLRTVDPNRSIQWEEFGEVLYLSEFIDAPQDRFSLNASALSGVTNLFGVTAGRRSHTWIGGNTALPGSFAEHLTSYGGYLFDQDDQMSILDWIYNGFSGSYGTVVEPCAITNKFVSPRMHYWYARGFSMGESLWMSVRNPYQGIYVGDPLCAPYAVASDVSWTGVSDGELVSGTVVITALVHAAGAAWPVDRVALSRNGRSLGIISNIPPQPGNVITVTINGTNRGYVVAADDTIYSVAAGLADEINQSPDLGVTASAHGDRILIKQDALGVGADGWACTASVAPGTAVVTTVHAYVPMTNFLESTINAREGLPLTGSSKSGDVVRVAITRLDGKTFTNELAVVENGTTPYTILFFLGSTVNADTNLQSSIGAFINNPLAFSTTSAETWVFARTNSYEGTGVFVSYEVDTVFGSTLSGPDFSDFINDNESVLGARATVFISSGVTQLQPVISVDTTAWPDGPNVLTVSAREGTGVRTESHASITLVVSNHDLTCAIDAPADGQYKLKAGILTVDVTAAVSAGSVTQLVLFAEGKSVTTGAVSSLSAGLDMSLYGAGPLRLQAHAWADGGRETISEIVEVELFTDNDGDGVSDQWERDFFVSVTNFNGDADADGDGSSNYEEFLSDTDPLEGMDYLSIASFGKDMSLEFDTSSRRRYQVQQRDDLFSGGWVPTGASFPGTGSFVVWTNTVPSTSNFNFKAVEPSIPLLK